MTEGAPQRGKPSPSRPRDDVADALAHDRLAEEAFRDKARTWLVQNAPCPIPANSGHESRLAAARSWQRLLCENGWAGISWPRTYGGQGLPARRSAIFQQEETKVLDWVAIKGPYNVAFHMAVPAILAYGTEEQRRSHIPALLRGEEFWCQLFSEPDAGSDLANLATTAVRDGDCYVVTGQKVWSSYAHWANFGLLLARTDPDVPKHQGISYFILDMSLAGVEVRPLRQMTGSAEFNEVFFDEVRVPVSARLGEENRGWAIAHSTLGNERQYLGVGVLTQPKFPALQSLAAASGRVDDPAARQRLVACYIREQVLRFMALRLQAAVDMDLPVGATPSLMKLAQSEHVVWSAADALALCETAGLGALPSDEDALAVRDAFLMSPAMRIGGGTDNIQKRTIAERILGLPRETDPGRSIPWRAARSLATDSAATSTRFPTVRGPRGEQSR